MAESREGLKDSKIFHKTTPPIPRIMKVLKFAFFNAFLGLSDVSTDLATFFTLVPLV